MDFIIYRFRLTELLQTTDKIKTGNGQFANMAAFKMAANA